MLLRRFDAAQKVLSSVLLEMLSAGLYIERNMFFAVSDIIMYVTRFGKTLHKGSARNARS